MTPGQPDLLRRDQAALVVIDVQEAFRDHVEEFGMLVERVRVLALAARALDVPVVVTEQYPKGLGPTAAELDDALGDAPRIVKRAFGAADVPGFAPALGGRSQVLLTGLEAHVCVHQTAAGLRAGGVDVHVCLDAVASQRARDREIGTARMLAGGARASGVETALFELLGTADDPAFKPVQRLIRDLATLERAGVA